MFSDNKYLYCYNLGKQFFGIYENEYLTLINYDLKKRDNWINYELF